MKFKPHTMLPNAFPQLSIDLISHQGRLFVAYIVGGADAGSMVRRNQIVVEEMEEDMSEPETAAPVTGKEVVMTRRPR